LSHDVQKIKECAILADRPELPALSTIISFVQQQARPRASAKVVPLGKNTKTFMGELPTP
jgi:hypothetical protein